MMVTVVQAKLASMIIIGVGSFVVGLAPTCLVSRVRYLRQKLLLTCFLCFGGGVLLATSILHMLPETRESMSEYAELLFSSGFLLSYLIDEFLRYFWPSDEQYVTLQSQSPLQSFRNDRSNQTEPCLNYCAATQSARNVSTESCYSNRSGNVADSGWKSTAYGALRYAPSAPIAPIRIRGDDEETVSGQGDRTDASLVGLLFALTVHSVLEGLAIGLQKATSEVFLLVGAVASHKFVVGFCLGLELADANSTFLKLLIAISVFSCGSAVGIGIGLLTLRMHDKRAQVVVSILQGLAGGTLLYVTVSEILPRERARWRANSRRSAGISQIFSVILGFVVILLLNNYAAT